MSPERLFRNYVFATLIGAAMIVGGYAVSVLATRQGIHDEESINVSGLQRTLSQRVLLLAERLNDTSDPYYLRLLQETVDQFEDGHSWLLQQVEPETALWDHYFAPGGAELDRVSQLFISQSRALIAQYELAGTIPVDELQQLEDSAIVDVLANLDQAAGLFEAAANARNEMLRQLELAALALVLAVMFMKAVFVFRPAHIELTGMIARLRLQAEADPLTGLANRRHFMAQARDILDRAAPNYGTVFLLAVDLDRFKEINDKLGHPAGDVVLRTIASSLETRARKCEPLQEHILARPGGDEFLFLGVVRDAPAEQVAEGLANALIAALGRPIVVPVEGAISKTCTVGASIGIASAQYSGDNIDHLVANGDIALYESKRAGKGIATTFTSEMREESERRNKWSNEIKRGLDELEFVAFFQPQVDIMTGQVIGMEALARWRHPELGLLTPAQFVDQVDEAHRTDALDGQIILQAVEMLQRCRGAGFHIQRVSINASGALLRDAGFAGMLSDLVTAYGLTPADFTVEVLENIVIHSGEDDAVASVRRLKAAGFTVAIDDFGSGFSSLESVGLLDCDVIKIDQSLIRRLDDPRLSKIVVASVAMAQGLGTRVYAEGVETQTHLDILDGLGVDVCQGYLVSKPLSPDDLMAWLATLERTGSTLPPIWNSPRDEKKDAA